MLSMYYRSALFQMLMFQFFAYCNGMELAKNSEEKTRPQIVTKRRLDESIFNRKLELPKRLKSTFVYYKALLEQSDNFSCGYRMLFHILCIERAVRSAFEKQTNLEEFLAPLLRNERYLHKCARKMQDYIHSIESDYDFSNGLTDQQITGFIETKLPHLKEKILIMYIDAEDNELVTKESERLTYKTGIHQTISTKIKGEEFIKLDNSKQLHSNLRRLSAPFDTCHFACMLSGNPNHWISASIHIDAYNEAKLSIIDSNNTYIEQRPVMGQCIEKLMNYVEEVNARNNPNTFLKNWH